MRTLFLLVALSGVSVAQDPAPVTGELAKFQGFWKSESVKYDGEEQLPTPEQRKLMTLVIKRDEYRMYVLADEAKDEHYRLLTAELTLKPGTNQFGLTVKTKAGVGQRRHGIYEFRGDKLVLCYADAEKAIPTAFASEPGARQFLEIWAKEATPTPAAPVK